MSWYELVTALFHISQERKIMGIKQQLKAQLLVWIIRIIMFVVLYTIVSVYMKGFWFIPLPFMVIMVFFALTCTILHKKLAAWQNKPELDTEHFILCVRSFLRICDSHDGGHIIGGLCGLVFLAIATPLSKGHEAPLIYGVYAVVFLTYTCAPAWSCVVEYKETFSKAFKEKLARRIQLLDEHILAIGYGKFGNTVIKTFLENYYSDDTVYSKHDTTLKKLREKSANQLKLFYEKMLNESCEEILFCRNLLIIDKDERYFNCVHEHPVLGKIGVLVTTQEPENIWGPRFSRADVGKKIYIPAIIGDILDSAVQSAAKFDKNRMVLSMVPGSEISLHIVDLISKKEGNKKGLISVSDMHTEFCLAPSSHNTEIEFLHGHQVSGWEIGDIAYANYSKRKALNKEKPKILVLGDGKQLHYILEKLWLEMDKDSTYLKNNCLIITEDSYINKATVSKIYKHHPWRYWHHRMGHVIGDKDGIILQNEYLIPCIEASPARPTILEEIIIGNALHQEAPWNLINYENLKKPDIVIIASNKGEEAIHIFHNINTIIKRNGFKFKGIKEPTIIVETNASLEDSINQCMERYADNTGSALKEDSCNLPQKNSGDQSTEYRYTYPIPFLGDPWPVNYSENIVDSFTLADTIVRGYVESMSSDSGAVLRACIRNDHPGSLAKLYFLLAGFYVNDKFKQTDDKEKEYSLPSFHNTSTLSHKSNHFCFFTNADLLKGVTNLCHNNDDIHAAFVSSSDSTDKIKKSVTL